MLVCCMTNISTWLHEKDKKIWLFNSWHLPFLNVPYSPFHKKWNTGILTLLVSEYIIGTVSWIKKDLELSPSPPNCSKDSWKLLVLFCLYLSTGQVWWINEFWSKIYIQECSCTCTNNHLDVTNLANHGMVILNIMKTENSFSMEFLNLFLRWHILRSYLFVAKVTFIKKHVI